MIISEIMYNPAGPDGVLPPDPTGEWVEIFNSGTEPVDVGGWRLDDEDATNWGPLPAGATLLPGEAAVLASNPIEFRQAWGANIKVFGVAWAALANTAGPTNEVLVLLDDTGAEVDRAHYEAGTNGWPPSVNGLSITLKDISADNNVGANWTLSVAGEAGAHTPAQAVGPYALSDVGSPGLVSNLVPVAPVHGAEVAAGGVPLTVYAANSQASQVTVRFFGRELTAEPPAPFRIVALPDTQYYSKTYPATFTAQTQWIVDHRQDMNIVYVAHEGDIVDDATVTTQWQRADAALRLLDAVPDLPLGLCVGNHDQDPRGDAAGTTAFNQWFPYTRYQNRPWYGGHYGTDNDNHYVLFSAGGMDFVAIHMEYDTSPSSPLLTWAANVLRTHSGRRAIVVAHSILNLGDPAPWTAQGGDIYNALKVWPNLFLMLCGHIHGENRRTDVYAGTVHTLLADYQGRDRGGDGWLRILEFVPADNAIHVKTYSPTLNRYERDADSEFTLAYDMGGAPFRLIGEALVPGTGGEATVVWPARTRGPTHQWYAGALGGAITVNCPVQSFTVAAPVVDLDLDGDVDLADFAVFQTCFNGPNRPHAGTGCADADFDGDADVDLGDFAVFQGCFNGPNRPPACP